MCFVVNADHCENFVHSIEGRRCTARVFGDGQAVMRALERVLKKLYLYDASPRTLKGSVVYVRSAPWEDAWVEYSRSCRYPNNHQCTYGKFLHDGEGWKLIDMWRRDTSDRYDPELSTLAKKVYETGRRKKAEAEWRQENAENAGPIRKGLKAVARAYAEAHDIDAAKRAFLSTYGIPHTEGLMYDLDLREAVPPSRDVTLKAGSLMVSIAQGLRRALKRRGVVMECGSARIFFK